MKIAIDSFSYYMHFGKHWYKPDKPVDIRWYCNLSKKMGTDGLHIDPYHIDLDKDAEWVRDFADKNGMYIELGACGTSIDELKPYIAAAKGIGANLLRTFVGGSCLDSGDIVKSRVAEAGKNLYETVALAEKYGVRLAIENHGDIYIEDTLYLMEINSEYLGVCFDSGNFAITGENPLDAIDAYGDRILCTHLKDVCKASSYPSAKPFETIGEPVHFCALGDGILPMDSIVKRLLEAGLERFTIEICTPYSVSINEDEMLKAELINVIKSVDILSAYEAHSYNLD